MLARLRGWERTCKHRGMGARLLCQLNHHPLHGQPSAGSLRRLVKHSGSTYYAQVQHSLQACNSTACCSDQSVTCSIWHHVYLTCPHLCLHRHVRLTAAILFFSWCKFHCCSRLLGSAVHHTHECHKPKMYSDASAQAERLRCGSAACMDSTPSVEAFCALLDASF